MISTRDLKKKRRYKQNKIARSAREMSKWVKKKGKKSKKVKGKQKERRKCEENDVKGDFEDA